MSGNMLPQSHSQVDVFKASVETRLTETRKRANIFLQIAGSSDNTGCHGSLITEAPKIFPRIHRLSSMIPPPIIMASQWYLMR